ncbi:PHP domain-containing protein [Vagococcus fluvialis]|uniref:PHP domain-containing protein n=1 Tax=Vagococcus fluvialis TaxID=2738 RepID=UPI002B3179F3|nr:PHP domain-containing protein [Vagococcus fluvialis]
MEIYYDQHLHTHHSFDSEEKIENYFKVTSKQLVTTEHLDFHNPYDNFNDNIPDFVLYETELKKLEQEFNRSILRGIEIGYVPAHDERINEFLADKPYDLLLLSTHQNDEIDFMDPIVRTFEKKRLIHEYYEQMIVSVEKMPHTNVLTHFDYGMRQIDITVDEFQKLAEPFLIQLFKQVIAADLAFELNAKSFVKYGNKHLYEYAVPLYISLGGTLFTLGSDAHVAEDYELGFAEMKTLLRTNGVSELAIFKEQKRKQVKF